MEKVRVDYTIKPYECGVGGSLKLLPLMNIIQDVAEAGAIYIGCGSDYCNEHNVAWFAHGYDISIIRMPKVGEKISVYTWPSVATALIATRDFCIKDEAGEVIINISTQWVLVNRNNHRPTPIKDAMSDRVLIDERALDSSFVKLPVGGEVNFSRTYNVRYDDIDVNGHVNNAIYPLWASETVESGFRMTHSLKSIEIRFKKESLYGEQVRVDTMLEGCSTLHTISTADGNTCLASVRIVWSEM